MKSPFPGMDPYLEQHWRDVHHNLVTFAQGDLNGQLPSGLRARVEERVYLEPDEGVGRSVYPDVRVVEHGRPGSTQAASGVAVAEPLIVPIDDDPATEGYIEIIDVGSGNRVITVIEFLSLSNKLPGEGQNLYLKKQRELLHGQVSLVEIDLLRSGKRVLAVRPEKIPRSHRTAYQASVMRSWVTGYAEVYSVPLRERLPTIKIPLRESDQDVFLDLQALIDQCYRNGRYNDIDYKAEPNPPLDPPDAAWADELLKAAGKR